MILITSGVGLLLILSSRETLNLLVKLVSLFSTVESTD